MGNNTHFSTVKAECSVNILHKSLHYRMMKLLIKLSLIASIIGLTMAIQLSDNVKNKPIQGVTVRFHAHPLPQFVWFHSLLNSLYVSQTSHNIYESLFGDNMKAALQDDSVNILCTWWTNKIVGKSAVSNASEKERCLALLKLLPFAALYQKGRS